MRVLMTTDTVGGVWTFTRELTEGLLNAGHAVALVSFGRAPSAGQREWAESVGLRFKERFQYVPSEAPLEWMQNNAESMRTASPLLLSLAHSFRAEIFHSNQLCFGDLPLEIPTLVTAHSDVLSWADACLAEPLESSPWLDRYLALVQAGLLEADAVAAPTAQMLQALGTHFSVPSRTSVIPNGRTLPPAPVEPARQRQAVSVGRLWDQAKGLPSLLEIDSPVPVLIAGEESFEAHSAATSSARIRSLGVLAEPDLLTLFRQSSVYLATSLYEPFGLAPLEAALCGCAILARDIPSLREIWGESALYFRSSIELERQLQELFSSSSRMRDAQAAASSRAQQFTAERMTSSYLALYQSLIPMQPVAIYPQEFAFHVA